MYKIINAVTGLELMLRNNKYRQWGNALIDVDEDYIENVRFSKKLDAFNCIIDFCQSGEIAQIVNTKTQHVITVSL